VNSMWCRVSESRITCQYVCVCVCVHGREDSFSRTTNERMKPNPTTKTMHMSSTMHHNISSSSSKFIFMWKFVFFWENTISYDLFIAAFGIVFEMERWHSIRFDSFRFLPINQSSINKINDCRLRCWLPSRFLSFCCCWRVRDRPKKQGSVPYYY
jgi:hypothetical protein